MRLEYRILEIAQGDEQECNVCFLDFDDPTLLNFDTAPATHQMVARNTPDGYSDIVFICGECKNDYDNNNLTLCLKCGRLKINKKKKKKKKKNKKTKKKKKEIKRSKEWSINCSN